MACPLDGDAATPWAARMSAATAASPAWSFVVTLAIASTMACGPSGDAGTALVILGPTPQKETPAPTPPPGPPVRATVTNGWTNVPVPRARVAMGSDTMVTDQAGQFELPTPVPCVPATVTADGFLERRVTCLAYAASQGAAPITLWPVESNEELAALRALAFSNGQLVRRIGSGWDVDPTIPDRDQVLAVWQRAAARLSGATATHLSVEIPASSGASVLIRPWAEPNDCRGPATRWFVTAGFCESSPPTYEIDAFILVPPARMTDEAVALRAFLYFAGLRPHALPGLLNEALPADDLSAFERRTLHMLTLRDRPWPGGIAWPDTEF